MNIPVAAGAVVMLLLLQPAMSTVDRQKIDIKILGNIIESVHFMVLVRIGSKTNKYGFPQPKDYPIYDVIIGSNSRTM